MSKEINITGIGSILTIKNNQRLMITFDWGDKNFRLVDIDSGFILNKKFKSIQDIMDNFVFKHEL